VTREEAAKLILGLREMAERVGHEFVPDEEKLEALGFSSEDIDVIWDAVQRVERFSEVTLAGL
jgi:hypothetical protein